MAKKAKRSKSTGSSSKVAHRSAVTVRYVKKARPEAEQFSRHFNKKYRSTLRELSKR